MLKRRFLAALLPGLVLAASLLAQEKKAAPPAAPETKAKAPAATPAADTPSFPTQLEQVIVDVVVTDKKGVPIKGLTAADVLPDTPAAKAGLQKGDILLEWAGKAIPNDAAAFQRMVADAKGNEPFDIVILRRGVKGLATSFCFRAET